MIAATDIDRIIGSDAVDQDNDKIGKVSQVYLDSDSERPTWATVKTGLFGTSETLVPLDDADWDEGTLHLAVDKARVKGAPRVDPDAEISVDEQQRLYAYYGFAADHHGDDGGGTSDGPGATDANRGRSESGDASRDRSGAGTSTTPGDDARQSGGSSGGAHVVASVDDTPASGSTDSNPAGGGTDFNDEDSLSYSRSDNDTSDLDAGLGSKTDPDDGPRTGVVGTAADRTIGGDRAPGSGSSENASERQQQGQQQQGEVRLRRYIVVEETVLAPRDGSDGSDDAR